MAENKGKIVNLRDRVTCYATDKHQYETVGAKLTMTKHLANYLAKKGWVTNTPPADKKAKKEDQQ